MKLRGLSVSGYLADLLRTSFRVQAVRTPLGRVQVELQGVRMHMRTLGMHFRFNAVSERDLQCSSDLASGVRSAVQDGLRGTMAEVFKLTSMQVRRVMRDGLVGSCCLCHGVDAGATAEDTAAAATTGVDGDECGGACVLMQQFKFKISVTVSTVVKPVMRADQDALADRRRVQALQCLRDRIRQDESGARRPASCRNLAEISRCVDCGSGKQVTSVAERREQKLKEKVQILEIDLTDTKSRYGAQLPLAQICVPVS
eukprot:2996123-Rhodomonas_salina.9